MKLAVLGDPLVFTLSPVLHRAGLNAVGLPCESFAIRTPPEALKARLAELRAAGFTGTNLTVPLKYPVIAHLDRVSPESARLRSVNTVGWDAGGAWGETTDGAGFLGFLAREGIATEGADVLILGAGGAARAVGGALRSEVRSLAFATRDPARHTGGGWEDLPAPAAFGAPETVEALARATLIVQATPLEALEGPLDATRVPAGAVAIDLRYGPGLTPWVLALRARGIRAFDGLGMLVHQARGSLALWSGRDIPLEALEAAVGWPR
jgi:shikimate dehydrogenase